MPRNFSPFFTNFFETRALLDERAYNSHIGLVIRLKTGALINVATHDFSLTSLSRDGASTSITPIVFESKLLAAPEIQFAQSDNADGSTGCTITNLDYLLTGLMVEPARLFDGATVTVYLCLKKDDGNYEGIIYGVGKVRVSDGDNNEARINYVSDVSDKETTAGGVELTQRCLNELGVINAFSFCPAPNLDESATCSKEKDDEDGGCAFYGMEAFIKAVPFFNPYAVNNYPLPVINSGGGGSSDGSGWDDYTRIGCPDLRSFLKTPTGWVAGWKLKTGDLLVDHFDRINTIEKIEIIRAEFRYLIEAPSGARGIFSASHPLLTAMNDEKGSTILSLLPTKPEDEKEIVEFSAGASRMTKFKISVAAAGDVLWISTTGSKIYVAGMTRGAGFAGHNKPAIYTGLEVWQY